MLRLRQAFDEMRDPQGSVREPYAAFDAWLLDRVARPEMPLADAAKLILLSFDSTLRSNFSVGMPLDLLLYRTDALRIALSRRIEKDDPYFHRLSQGWSNALRQAFNHLDGLDIEET